MKEKLTFLEFCNQLRGYDIYNEKGFQVYKYELFWWKISPTEVFESYKLVLRPIDESKSALI
jgi:hypothetical protein